MGFRGFGIVDSWVWRLWVRGPASGCGIETSWIDRFISHRFKLSDVGQDHTAFFGSFGLASTSLALGRVVSLVFGLA